MLFARWLGARRVLCNDADTEFDDRKPEHLAHRKIEHEILSGFRVAGELLRETGPGPLYFMPPDAQIEKARARLSGLKPPIVALNFSARVTERSWPYSRWCELAAMLAKDNSVVILGAPAMWNDPSFSDAMTTAGLRSVAHTLPTADFVELAAAISLCDRVICCDGGPVHIAAALKKPVVVLFENRPEKYKRWYPWGVPYQIALSRNGIAVETVAVSDVLAAYEKLCSMAPPVAAQSLS
jgi:ADP-heptose:LPS heptosyltransferase